MKSFYCACGARVFFDNSQCLQCGRELGFAPDQLSMLTLSGDVSGETEAEHGRYRKCANYALEGVCNWMVPVADESELCQACQLNHVIPDLSQPDNRQRWLEVERAKRRLVYGLNSLHLPLAPKTADPERGLSFDIKADEDGQRVLTGHSDGLITLNVSEADPAERERMRVAMKERYRTLLGHFRHEIGHYYWDRLVRDGAELEAFRALFGDERRDYAEALKQHYASAPDPSYSEQFISAYAAAHPWEDFAESFAHYLHMVDTLETAQQFGFAAGADACDQETIQALLTEWYGLTVALNALNRSMGAPDPYPFAISPAVAEKLGFVHRLVYAARRASSSATFSSKERAGPEATELSASTAV